MCLCSRTQIGRGRYYNILQSDEDSLPSGDDNHVNCYPLIPWKKKTYYCWYMYTVDHEKDMPTQVNYQAID